MKLFLSILIFPFWINLTGQNNSGKEIMDCESATIETVNVLVEKFTANELDSFDILVDPWIKICGVSECTQRFIIIKNILMNESSANAIEIYFQNDLQYVFNNRVESSKRINYGYIYADRKAYFGFVPLRHTIDSIIIQKSSELLKSDRLTPDERLICIMFSGDIELFYEEIKKHAYNESFIKQFVFKNYRENSNRWLAYNIYTGVYKPIGPNKIFHYSPIIGFTFSSPLRNKLVVELGVKFRMNINDRSFKYYALGDTNTVNSDVSIFFGGLVGYKLFDNEKLIVMPKVGIGLESVSTGLSKTKNKSNEKTYYDIETFHFSVGLHAMKPFFKKSYIGIGVNYHYCPYQIDNNLYTRFDNNLISSEIFWRF